LPRTHSGQVSAIAIGNYPNDHHYPSGDIPLHPKAIRWGGRWTGTPFTIPYDALVPETIDGFLTCEKNISVSHMANGATRLQPVVMGLGQAAGMAAALCVQQSCQPRDLGVRTLQTALLNDPTAPTSVIPLFNLLPNHPGYRSWQQKFLDEPESYPVSGYVEHLNPAIAVYPGAECDRLQTFIGQFHGTAPEQYSLKTQDNQMTWQLVTLDPQIQQQLSHIENGEWVTVKGWPNSAGNWLKVHSIQISNSDINPMI
jgi:hypothetical protein